MGRHSVKVNSLYNYTIDSLRDLTYSTTNEHNQSALTAVIMCYSGFSTTDIMKALGKSRPTVVSYINKWNESPLEIFDDRGNNIPSSFDSLMLEHLKDIVTSKTPSDFGLPQSAWNSEILAQYIEISYGKKYSSRWIRIILNSLGFTYKRGVYKPSKADAQLQESYKKNGSIFGHI